MEGGFGREGKKKKERIKRGSRFTRISAYYAHISDDILNGASYYGVDRFAPRSWNDEKKKGWREKRPGNQPFFPLPPIMCFINKA